MSGLCGKELLSRNLTKVGNTDQIQDSQCSPIYTIHKGVKSAR